MHEIKKPEKKQETGITFREAAARWRKEHVELRLKPSTKKYYVDLVKDFLNPFFGDMPLAEITRRNVKEAVAFWVERAKASESKRGERSIPNALRTGGALLSWAIEEELVTVNPFLNPGKVFKVESFQGDYLRPEEVTPYLDGVRKKAPRYYPILRTMLYAGLRVGEAARDLPNVIEQSVRNAAVQNANQMRTEDVEGRTPLTGESVSV